MSARLPILLVSVVLAARVAAAQGDVGPERAFYRGNDLFEQKSYAEAITAYRAAVDSGHESAALLYNLGCAYLFSGRTGDALYHLRRAERLAPRDEDIQKNIGVARTRASDKISRPAPPKFVQTLLYLHEKTTPSEALTLFTVLWLLGMLLLHVRIFVASPWLTRLAVLLLAAGLLMGCSLSARALGLGETREGVILPPEVGVFTGPSDTAYSVFFKLHAGAEVEVLETRDGWVKIAVDDERRGFVPESQIGRLSGS